MYANTKAIGRFDLGKLCFNYQDPEYQKNRTTRVKVVHTKDGKKKVTFQGVKKKLKQSQ